ncbi:ATP-binding cassette domain-containing protein [Aquihabitans sp. G128]|uniref:ABC transporter ATP-binding protein n=1 Tax=Aquihabitans sp. G128 TaxID=2849779 RepID=UPI001C2132E8|nr:ATP-binding cassette domain-containing protein [Aquihabitans sp. G128]QXC60815.1 ATP-binding cassette domain-containing protein [Aquihabitans sp. G128]
MIEARGLTKRYGGTVAVDDLSFRVESGRVTGFLGPNGAGKSTTMRMVLGLDRTDGGAVRIDDKRLVDFDPPMREVGALLDAAYVHPTRKAKDHLWALAASNGLPRRRVDEVLALVGLTEVAGKRVGGFSLGMKQRLGLAGAMLGDPHTVLFDEPANGLDPEGIQWMRHFLQGLAKEGRTVFVSSHLLSEMALVAQDLVVIGRGALIFQGPVADFVAGAARSWVTVRSPQVQAIAAALAAQGAQVTQSGPDAIDVVGPDSTYIGELAAQQGAVLHELSPRTGSLEDAFLEVTAGAQQYRGVADPGAPGQPPAPGLAPPPPPPPPGPTSGGPV